MCPPAAVPVIDDAHLSQIQAVFAAQVPVGKRAVAKSPALVTVASLWLPLLPPVRWSIPAGVVGTIPAIVAVPMIWKRLGNTCVERS
jgi:hypothetical protein